MTIQVSATAADILLCVENSEWSTPVRLLRYAEGLYWRLGAEVWGTEIA